MECLHLADRCHSVSFLKIYAGGLTSANDSYVSEEKYSGQLPLSRSSGQVPHVLISYRDILFMSWTGASIVIKRNGQRWNLAQVARDVVYYRAPKIALGFT